MNRLILIGNGFDLAHELKTSFGDFIEDYLNRSCKKVANRGQLKDKLISLKLHGYTIDWEDVDGFEKFDALNEINSKSCYAKYESDFFENLCKKFTKARWIDIENEYFTKLKILARRTDEQGFEELKQLNAEFDNIRNELISYLDHKQKVIQPDALLNYSFFQSINKNELFFDGDLDIEKVMFLNFNYTNTIEQYVQCLKENDEQIEIEEVNYIHGKLGDENNPPIFGYGDEHDEDYKKFENMGNIELFRHIKSFQYFNSWNYYNLLRFIEEDDFQVHIYGHSCGVSDRTLVNQIFEHKKCQSIKIFYYEWKDEKGNKQDDFSEKTKEISKHFKNKVELRRKLVPKCFCEPMPQLKKQKAQVEEKTEV